MTYRTEVYALRARLSGLPGRYYFLCPGWDGQAKHPSERDLDGSVFVDALAFCEGFEEFPLLIGQLDREDVTHAGRRPAITRSGFFGVATPDSAACHPFTSCRKDASLTGTYTVTSSLPSTIEMM